MRALIIEKRVQNLNGLTTAEWSMRFRHLARYRRRQFCELGLQTSHVCAVIFSGYRIFLANENSEYSNKISNVAQLPF